MVDVGGDVCVGTGETKIVQTWMVRAGLLGGCALGAVVFSDQTDNDG